MHPDLLTDDLDAAIATFVRLGGRELGARHEYDEGPVATMADPAGHEFCLVEYAWRSSPFPFRC